MFRKAIIAIVGGTALWLGVIGAAFAEEAKGCYPIATLKISFRVVFPEARQVTIDGDAARAYLSEYNNFGTRTEFRGETLFLNILPNGTTMLVPLHDGLGCKRMIVGPKVHRLIMAKVSRGAV